MAYYIELYMDQGYDFEYDIHMENDITNSNINVAGYLFTGQMRRSPYSANSSGEFVYNIVDSTNGDIIMSMSASNTANIPIGKYFFETKAVTPDNYTTKIIEGLIIVNPGIVQ